jgi:hypothetical protein
VASATIVLHCRPAVLKLIPLNVLLELDRGSASWLRLGDSDDSLHLLKSACSELEMLRVNKDHAQVECYLLKIGRLRGVYLIQHLPKVPTSILAKLSFTGSNLDGRRVGLHGVVRRNLLGVTASCSSECNSQERLAVAVVEKVLELAWACS